MCLLVFNSVAYLRNRGSPQRCIHYDFLTPPDFPGLENTDYASFIHFSSDNCFRFLTPWQFLNLQPSFSSQKVVSVWQLWISKFHQLSSSYRACYDSFWLVVVSSSTTLNFSVVVHKPITSLFLFSDCWCVYAWILLENCHQILSIVIVSICIPIQKFGRGGAVWLLRPKIWGELNFVQGHTYHARLCAHLTCRFSVKRRRIRQTWVFWVT